VNETATLLKYVNVNIRHRCNLDCVMCRLPEWVRTSPHTDIELSDVLTLCSGAADAGAERIRLRGLGEPTLHPHFPSICRAVTARHIALCLDATNGQQLADLDCTCFVSDKPVQIYVSVHAGEAAMYERVQRGAQWEVLWRGIDRLRTEAPAAHITVRSVLLESCAHTLGGLVPMLAERGIDRWQVAPLMVHEGMESELLGRQQEADLSQRLAAVAAEHGLACDPVPMRRPRPYCGEEMQGRLCPSPFQHVHVSLEGNVSPCPQLQFRGYFVGSICRESVADLFAGRGYQRLRNAFTSGEVPPVCAGCPALGANDA